MANSENEKTEKIWHPHDEVEGFHHLHHGKEFYDDAHGGPLDKDLAVKAGKFEIEFLGRMEVYTKVDRSAAQMLNAKVATTKWIDTSKGDDHSPDYRARLVGREIKIEQRPGLFAATPSLESLRMILIICASKQNRREPFRTRDQRHKASLFLCQGQTPNILLRFPLKTESLVIKAT